MVKKPLWRRIWYFIWEDDSPLSWIINVVIAFILIKYLIYPGLGLVMGTTHPVVAVVSGSMEHGLNSGTICGTSPAGYKNNFDSFWAACGGFYSKYSIDGSSFRKYPFRDGFNTGDIIVLTGLDPGDVKIGDVIVFQANRPDPIIHRVISISEQEGIIYYSTKGDHNPGQLEFEQAIHERQLIGKARFRIPLLGYIKIGFVNFLNMIGLGNSLGRLF